MGAEYYELHSSADATVVPAQQFEFYKRKSGLAARHFFWSTMRCGSLPTATPPAQRTALAGIRDFVFCCFNQVRTRSDPTIFAVWMRLCCKRSDGQRVVAEGTIRRSPRTNLRLEAERCGVASERLVFAPPVPRVRGSSGRGSGRPDLFPRLRLNYNAHTTRKRRALGRRSGSWTCIGSTFRRTGGGKPCCGAVGLPELVTETLADYEALALRLAARAARLLHGRQGQARAQP